jgi:hypothetical protein
MDDSVKQYKICFSGQVLPGNTLDEVKERTARALKLSVAASERLFQQQGLPIVIKRFESLEKANIYCKKLNRLGMVLDIEEQINLPVSNLTKAHDLSIVPIQKKLNTNTAIVTSEKGGRNKIYETIEVVESNSSFIELALLLKLPIFLLLIGFFLCIVYLPYPDGLLRKGFIFGSVLLFIVYNTLWCLI